MIELPSFRLSIRRAGFNIVGVGSKGFSRRLFLNRAAEGGNVGDVAVKEGVGPPDEESGSENVTCRSELLLLAISNCLEKMTSVASTQNLLYGDFQTLTRSIYTDINKTQQLTTESNGQANVLTNDEGTAALLFNEEDELVVNNDEEKPMVIIDPQSGDITTFGSIYAAGGNSVIAGAVTNEDLAETLEQSKTYTDAKIEMLETVVTTDDLNNVSANANAYTDTAVVRAEHRVNEKIEALSDRMTETEIETAIALKTVRSAAETRTAVVTLTRDLMPDDNWHNYANGPYIPGRSGASSNYVFLGYNDPDVCDAYYAFSRDVAQTGYTKWRDGTLANLPSNTTKATIRGQIYAVGDALQGFEKWDTKTWPLYVGLYRQTGNYSSSRSYNGYEFELLKETEVDVEVLINNVSFGWRTLDGSSLNYLYELSFAIKDIPVALYRQQEGGLDNVYLTFHFPTTEEWSNVPKCAILSYNADLVYNGEEIYYGGSIFVDCTVMTDIVEYVDNKFDETIGKLPVKGIYSVYDSAFYLSGKYTMTMDHNELDSVFNPQGQPPPVYRTDKKVGTITKLLEPEYFELDADDADKCNFYYKVTVGVPASFGEKYEDWPFRLKLEYCRWPNMNDLLLTLVGDSVYPAYAVKLENEMAAHNNNDNYDFSRYPFDFLPKAASSGDIPKYWVLHGDGEALYAVYDLYKDSAKETINETFYLFDLGWVIDDFYTKDKIKTLYTAGLVDSELTLSEFITKGFFNMVIEEKENEIMDEDTSTPILVICNFYLVSSRSNDLPSGSDSNLWLWGESFFRSNHIQQIIFETTTNMSIQRYVAEATTSSENTIVSATSFDRYKEKIIRKLHAKKSIVSMRNKI